MTGEHREVIRVQPLAIAQFHTVRPAARKLPKKIVQRFNEHSATSKIALAEAGELECDQTHLVAERFPRRQKGIREKSDIEKMRVGPAGSRTEARELGELFERDV